MLARQRFWFGLAVASLGLIGQNSGLAAEPLWLRYPAISPDAAEIAFAYQGDLYVVPAKGGLATPLAIHEAHDFKPVWSRDAKQIAFASDRYGNFDVFVVSAAGGNPRRVTFNSAHDYPSDFSPDGKWVLFESQRRDSRESAQFPLRLLPELYQAPVAGGPAVQVFTTPAQDARFDQEGLRILYHDRKGYENEWRKHHVSSIARDVWLYEQNTGKHMQLTAFRGEDRNPVWGNDDQDLYYLSEKSGSFNVWRMPLDQPDKAEQLTQHQDHPVRCLSRAKNGTLCYGFNGELYLLPPRAMIAKLRWAIGGQRLA